MSKIYNINLMPIEPLLFGDNRSSRAGDDHLILDQDPSPHTIFSSISTYFIKVILNKRDLRIDSSNWQVIEPFLGPFKTTLEDNNNVHAELCGYCFRGFDSNLWFPKPLHFLLRYINGSFFKGESISIVKNGNMKSSSSFEHYIDANHFKDEYKGECLISEKLLESVLCNTIPQLPDVTDKVLPKDYFFRAETRLGLKMKKGMNTTEIGMLFSRPYRRFRAKINNRTKEWSSVSFQAWYKTLKPIDEKKKGITFLGGDRRRAIIEINESTPLPLMNLLSKVKAKVKNTKGFFAYLLTPAVKKESWPVIEGMKPIAAAMGKELAISGWNTDKNHQTPRPILRLIPAGSVFFYHWPSENEKQRSEIIEKHWSEPISESYRGSGFGRILIGVWS